jgi:hypothetical protein
MGKLMKDPIVENISNLMSDIITSGILEREEKLKNEEAIRQKAFREIFDVRRNKKAEISS